MLLGTIPHSSPKMSEMCGFVLCNKVSLAFIIETWLQSFIAVSIIDIPGYSVLRSDSSSDHHGGVCLYINAEIRYKRLDALSCCPGHEVLYVQLRPKRLPRGFSSLIVAAFIIHIGLPLSTSLCKNTCSSHCNLSSHASLIALLLWQETSIVLTGSQSKGISASSK